MLTLDRLIIEFDKGLRTALSSARTLRPMPGDELPETELSPADQRLSAALMRVNHAGEVCAQALYRGQALTAKEPKIQESMRAAASEETEHLAWTEKRIKQLGARKSMLSPLWYFGSLALGATAGTLDKKWNLGFLAETEIQVERHLASHLERLPTTDHKSRAIVVQMKQDESRHATTAIANGGAQLPLPIRVLMSLSSRIMTHISFWF